MEGEGASVDAEESVPTQHLNIPVLKVERAVAGYGHGINSRLVGYRKFGETSDADGQDLGDGRCGDRIDPRGGDWFWWIGLRDLD